jgi:hypothetical protein
MAIERIERFAFGAVAINYQRSIGEDTINIHNQHFDICKVYIHFLSRIAL